MADTVAIETVSGIAISFDPSNQKYQATINDKTVSLKSLNELRKRCRATFAPIKILLIKDAPKCGTSSYNTGLDTETIRGISEHSSNYGKRKEYRLQVDAGSYGGHETRLSAEMYVYDEQLEASLMDLEREGNEFLARLRERWQLTVSELGRRLRIEDLMQGQIE